MREEAKAEGVDAVLLSPEFAREKGIRDLRERGIFGNWGRM